jgi:hypothetical protein
MSCKSSTYLLMSFLRCLPYPDCEGIDPYTLMAPHGPRQTRWPNSPERAARISELLGEPCGARRDYLMVKETKLIRIDIVSSMDTAVVIS